MGSAQLEVGLVILSKSFASLNHTKILQTIQDRLMNFLRWTLVLGLVENCAKNEATGNILVELPTRVSPPELILSHCW